MDKKAPAALKIRATALRNRAENLVAMADKIEQEFVSLDDITGGGLLDFLVLAELPDSRKYEYLAFPESDVWGLIIPIDDPLAKKK